MRKSGCVYMHSLSRHYGIAKLLRETGHAHHEAFAATDGADPDWPIWYAEYSKDLLLACP